MVIGYLPSVRFRFYTVFTPGLVMLHRMRCTGGVGVRGGGGGGGGGGGVALFWNKNIESASIIPGGAFDGACGIRIQNSAGGVCYVWNVYLPAMGAGEDLGTSLDELSEVVECRDPGGDIIIMGDLNGDIGSFEGGGGSRESTQRGELVRGFMRRKDLIATNMMLDAKGPSITFEGPFNSST